MTRSRRASQGSICDRHLQRNGGEVQRHMKKNGAGSFNWGSPYDDLEDWLAVDYEMESMGEEKVKVLDENSFKVVKEMYGSSP
ncbi:hypothetical protein HDU97_001956 [Phlyctochytrium planicorne]|nr:hypothetical protein HDU97_001956 [Phlyctochytrium planicorne]